MDQSKTNLPYSSVVSKSASTLWRLRTHISGALVHTKAPHGKLGYTYIDMLQWQHGSNLTITVILKTLYEYQKDHVLPPNLYLQMDNTCRENKNRYVLAFCALLVQAGVFEKVTLCNRTYTFKCFI